VARAGSDRSRDSEWTFLTNHAHVLLAIARDPHCRLRDVATRVGITERSVQAIVADLEAEGYLTRSRVGRRNVYRLHPQRRFRHPAESRHRIGELLKLFSEQERPDDGGSEAAEQLSTG
jgi:DNA-binding MarR family transcriptional regulator